MRISSERRLGDANAIEMNPTIIPKTNRKNPKFDRRRELFILKSKKQYEARKAAHDARYKEKLPMPWWWLGQREPVARFNAYLVIATVMLFLIAIKTDSTLKETLIASNRAWIAPKTAT
jgi:hypothetical protein